jgi:aminodeoxyfutalosine deaminase
MTAYTLRARWVLPVDQPPIDGGYVSVADGRITAVGRRDPELTSIRDLGDVVLMPGLVNAHTHLEFSDLGRPLGSAGMRLPEWIRLVIGDRKRGGRDPAAAIAAGFRESLAGGVTTLGEIATSPAACYAAAGACPATVQFLEVIAFSTARADSVFGEVERRLFGSPPGTGISPHAPYTVHPNMVRRIVELATSRNVPVAMHLAESAEELRLLSAGDGPFRELLEERSMWDPSAIPLSARPLDYLRMLADAPRALVIHGNYLDDEEMAFIAQRRERMAVVYCPRTHAYFGHSRYPLEAMLNGGLRVTLGADSRASNPDLSLLAELRFAAGLYPEVSPERLVQMATINGAKALGLADRAGRLAAGKRADLVALPCDLNGDDPYDELVHGAAAPAAVWLGGERVQARD